MRQATWRRCPGLVAVRRLRLATAGVVLCAVLASAPVARGDATVSLSNDRLTTSVTPRSGPDGAHGILVEPLREPAGRNGFRVRQDRNSRPAFSTNDADCSVNFVFNDVICVGPRGSAVVTGGDGPDTVIASETPGGQETLPRVPVTVTIQDRSRNFEIPNSLFAGVFGGALAGLACLPLPAAANGVFGDRPGGPVEVNLGAGSDFVAAIASTHCTVAFSVEGGFLPRLTANGGSGTDSLVGGPAGDILNGGTNDDEIRGGPGRDTLRGEGGEDFLDSQDGERDLLVDCGANAPGGFDTAIVDSGDVGGPTGTFLLGPLSVIRNCEFVIGNPIDDGPPGALLGRRLRIREDGLTRVRIACRRASLVRCRGRVSVSDPRHLARVLVSAPYAIRLGARKRVVLKLTSAERALLRRRGRAVVTTKEQGRSSRGPRGALRTFGIAGAH